MGKKKLQRFAENKTFKHLLEPVMKYPPADHKMKGRWNECFFSLNQPLVLELGCGRGEYTINLAQVHPHCNYLGIDIKGARLWRGAKTAAELKMTNVGFLRTQIELIDRFFAAGEVDEVWITFPDPQPLRSREKKRLTSPRFLKMYTGFLKPGGTIHLKTDNRPLYEYSLETAKQLGAHIECATHDLYQSSLADEIRSIQTTYEKKFLEQGLSICYLRYTLP
jgi:tRNA (guanine-N7-)-methyltransferase